VSTWFGEFPSRPECQDSVLGQRSTNLIGQNFLALRVLTFLGVVNLSPIFLSDLTTEPIIVATEGHRFCIGNTSACLSAILLSIEYLCTVVRVPLSVLSVLPVDFT
jgi:hypothetical protein